MRIYKMNTQDKTSLSLTQEVTGAVTTANALKMAKKELNHQRYGIGASELSFDDVIKAIEEALEAKQVCQEDSRVRQNDVPAQEPVAWVYRNKKTGDCMSPTPKPWEGYEITHEEIPLYTHPAQPWQGNKEFVTLTDDEIVAKVFDNDELLARILYLDGVSKGLEQALKEKNT